MRAVSLKLTVVFALGVPAVGHAQSTPVSELWREWDTVSLEWQREVDVFAPDRQRGREVRRALADGLDPRDPSSLPRPSRASVPAGPR
ncbi:MAG: hypothetical protein EXR76_13040 [Myxococcales bacterium]|nr:hypothetical protein [Myxococcales bacterium]